jgi:hypothetical protein
MADELERYWFVAAVYREPQDLAATIRELGKAELAGDRLLVVSMRAEEDVRKSLDDSDAGGVHVVTMQASGAWRDGDGRLPPPRIELRSMLAAMVGDQRLGPQSQEVPVPVFRNGQSEVYKQLREDVSEGAFILIASVTNAQEQLRGARILLRGNCECVLTHELAVQHP